MIRLATKEDTPHILSLCLNFFNASSFSSASEFNEDHVTNFISGVLDKPLTEGVVLLAYREKPIGILASLKTQLMFSGEDVSCELVWWVEPEYRRSRDGLELLSAYEYWAKHVAKVSKIQVSNLTPEVEKIYRKRGYVPQETAWIKGI